MTTATLPNLIILNGPSGAGKSTAAALLARQCDPRQLRVFPKYRTHRTPRASEIGDTIELSATDFAAHSRSADFYLYSFGAARYGFHLDDLRQALRSSRNVILIIRHEAITRALRRNVVRDANVVTVYLRAAKTQIWERLVAAGDLPERIDERLRRDARLPHDPSLYAHEISNNGDLDDLVKSFRTLLALYDTALAA
jgi:ribose 1,5-bisphosphokinase PhnN